MSRRTSHRSPLLALAALAVVSLAGCDDVLLFDVGGDGRLLVTCDALGRTAAIGDGEAPRHLAWVDPTTGEVTRITSTTLALTWPRACGQGAVVVLERRRLVQLVPDHAPRVLLESARRLDQPVVSPDGEHVAVLESTTQGVPGRVRVVAVATGEVGLEVEGALLGFAWVGDDALLVPLATAPRAQPFAPGAGEVVRVSLAGERDLLLRGTLPGATWLASAGGRGLAVVPLAEATGPVGLVGFSLDGPGARRGEAAGVCDLWPAVDALTSRVLFTRARPERPSLEGELRLTALDDLARSTVVPTPGMAVAPRWVGAARLAYLTPDDRLVVQDLDGTHRLELSARLRAACFGDAP